MFTKGRTAYWPEEDQSPVTFRLRTRAARLPRRAESPSTTTGLSVRLTRRIRRKLSEKSDLSTLVLRDRRARPGVGGPRETTQQMVSRPIQGGGSWTLSKRCLIILSALVPCANGFLAPRTPASGRAIEPPIPVSRASSSRVSILRFRTYPTHRVKPCEQKGLTHCLSPTQFEALQLSAAGPTAMPHPVAAGTQESQESEHVR